MSNENVLDFPPVPRYQIIISLRSRISEAQWLINTAIEESNFDRAEYYANVMKLDIKRLGVILEEEEQSND